MMEKRYQGEWLSLSSSLTLSLAVEVSVLPLIAIVWVYNSADWHKYTGWICARINIE
jgi:hypothetical protein